MSEGPAGVIIGGWPFVIAAYSITVVALTANIARLMKKERDLDRNKELDCHD